MKPSPSGPPGLALSDVVGPAVTAVVGGFLILIAWRINPMMCVLVSLGTAGAVGLATAMRTADWNLLKLSSFHVLTTGLIGAVAAGFAIAMCLDYNRIAGTDKTPLEIGRIAAGVFLGPLVGPIANPGAGERVDAIVRTGILALFVISGAAPFLLVRRRVSTPAALVAWIGFLCGLLLWFLGALVSLAVFLS